MSANDPSEALSSRQLAVLMASVLVIALCGIAYELIIATVSSYLLGDSVYQFSITIGLFMFAMGLGSYLTKLVQTDLVSAFVAVELSVAFIGGISSTLLFAVFPYYALYKPVMYGLIIVIGTLVGFEIPLLTRILTKTGTLKESIAHVLSLDYFGALIGSVAFPLLMLPYLGLFRSSYAIGLLNVFVGFCALFVFGNRLRWRWACWLSAISVLVILWAGLISSTLIRSYAEGRLFADSIIYTEQTPYQRIVLTKHDVDGKLRMYLDGHIQFCEKEEYRYHEALVHPVLAIDGPRSRILILGGGDGMAVREALKHDDVESIDLVDIDERITTLSRDFAPISRLNQDSLKDPRVTIYNLDAFAYVRESDKKFDRIIIDFPDPRNEALAKLYSVEFYKFVKRVLAPGGYVVTQSSSPYFTREVFWCIARTLQEAGFNTYSYHVHVPTFGTWGFTLAGLDGEVPTDITIDVPTQFLTTEVFAKSGVFGRDVSKIDVPVNSLYQPNLYRLYRLGVTR